MNIKRFSVRDAFSSWELSPVEFGPLTLLVGVSGVGKTRILTSLYELKKVTTGSALNGRTWRVEFTTVGSEELYLWEGCFEYNANFGRPEFEDDDDSNRLEKKSKVISERIYLGGKLIAERNGANVKFAGKVLPKLSNTESLVKTLSAEKDIAPIVEGFSKMLLRSAHEGAAHKFLFPDEPIKVLAKKHKNLASLQKSKLDTDIKLAIACLNNMPIFKKIEDRFKNVFPQVEAIKFSPWKDQGLPYFLQESPTLQIRERGQSKWFPGHLLSSGMRKTLVHISEIFLWPTGTVFLIDEFENSLGVNCLDVVTDDLLTHNAELQFIITSHHPYIINHIGMESWKIVTRKGAKVDVRNASDFPLGKSKHAAFLQLTNLTEFYSGVSS